MPSFIAQSLLCVTQCLTHVSFAFTCPSVYSHDIKLRAIYVLGRSLRKALGLTVS